jgi:hypothetical protein
VFTLLVALYEEIVASQLLLSVLDGVKLVNARTIVRGVATEGDIEQPQEGVHAGDQGLRSAGIRFHTGSTVVHNNSTYQQRIQ